MFILIIKLSLNQACFIKNNSRVKNLMKKVILITGCAGFIGYHLCYKLLKNDFLVVGLDNINSYYDTKLKN